MLVFVEEREEGEREGEREREMGREREIVDVSKVQMYVGKHSPIDVLYAWCLFYIYILCIHTYKEIYYSFSLYSILFYIL